MGIRQIAGRTFTAADIPDGDPVCVIDESLARRLFPNESPLGRRLKASIQRKVWRTVAMPALRGMLYGVGPHDAVALATAALLLVATALGAAYIPARRLLRLDVVGSLRE